MTLDDLEHAYRQRQRAAGAHLVIVAMQIEERDIRTLRPELEAKGESLSEHVRTLLHRSAGMPVPMMEVR